MEVHAPLWLTDKSSPVEVHAPPWLTDKSSPGIVSVTHWLQSRLCFLSGCFKQIAGITDDFTGPHRSFVLLEHPASCY